MELQTVQHIDISNAVTSVISVDELSEHALFQQDEEEVAGISYVTVRSTPRHLPIQLLSGVSSQGTLSFKARPLFPGSLLSTEVCVYLSDQEGTMVPNSALMEHCQLDSGTLDSPVETNLYYRLHAPLPAYLASHPYQSESSVNCIALISNQDSLRQVDTILARSLINRMADDKRSGSGNRKAPIRLYMETNPSTDPSHAPAPTRYHQFKAEQLDHACHRLSVIGKAGLVMCDTAGIAVDAIRGCVPAVFITTVPDGYENIQASVLDFLQHGDRAQLISDQRNVLRQIQESFSEKCHVLSNQSTLRALLTVCITMPKGIRSPSLDKIFSSNIFAKATSHGADSAEHQSLILRTQQTFCSASSKSVRFKSGLASSRRKFQKFKESPSRFMEDSQIRILRSLVNPRT